MLKKSLIFVICLMLVATACFAEGPEKPPPQTLFNFFYLFLKNNPSISMAHSYIGGKTNYISKIVISKKGPWNTSGTALGMPAYYPFELLIDGQTTSNVPIQGMKIQTNNLREFKVEVILYINDYGEWKINYANYQATSSEKNYDLAKALEIFNNNHEIETTIDETGQSATFEILKNQKQGKNLPVENQNVTTPAPKLETPKAEVKVEAPKAETKTEALVVSPAPAPKAEAPKVETPKAPEAQKVEASKPMEVGTKDTKVKGIKVISIQ